MRRLSRLLAAVLAFGTAQCVWAADQYWVGGASGLWGDDNWADAADGTGAAWTNGSRSVFTTTPAAVDLAGFSPTATYLTGSGFSNGNLCKIAVTDSSETVPTLTLTSAGSDFTVASFTNVNVHCTATGNFGLNNSSHLYFGEGSKFTMAGGGRFLVGNSISCSNSLVVAAGAEATVSKALWIGCGSQNSLHPIGVVHVAGGELTVNENVFMGRHTSTADNHWKYGNGGTGVLWVESGTCNVNGEIISNAQYLNSGETSKYTQRTRIIVGKNGALKVSSNIRNREWCAEQTFLVDGGLLQTAGGLRIDDGGTTVRNYTLTVRNGGTLALANAFHVNTSGTYGWETILFDNGTFKALNSFATASNGSRKTFTVGGGGMTIDTQGFTLTWQLRIDAGAGKVVKKGAGTLSVKYSPYNTGGMEIAEGLVRLESGDQRIVNGPVTVKEGAMLEIASGNSAPYHATAVTFEDGAKLKLPYSAGTFIPVKSPSFSLEGQLDVSFSATLAPGAYPLLTITGEGTFDEGVLSRINKPDGDAYAGASLALSADAKSVMLVLGSDPVWIGGTSGDLGDPANWSTGVVPGPNTNAIITVSAAVTLTNSAAFKATSITFAAGCPKVTIEGDPLVGLEAINNLSSANHEFKAAVSGDVVTISNTTTYCVFSGGLTANGVSFGTQACLAGSTLKFTFTERGTAPELVFSQAMGTMFAVRAANYNIRCKTSEGDSANNWDNRKADLVTLVKIIAPDVIGFQEVRSAQYDYLKGQLSGYEFYGRYRDDSSNSEACPIAYLKSRFTFLEGGTFWLSATPSAVGSKVWGNGIEDSGYPRICTWALLKDKATGGVFCFIGTHLDLNAGPRLAGMRLILSSLVERYDAVDVPIALVGDMNAVETEASMLAATAVMQDSLLASKTTPTGSWRTYNAFSWKSSEVSNADALANYTAAERTAASSTLGSRIDYIFASYGIDVESFATRNDARPGKQYYPSDHYPVVADLRLPYANNLYGGKVRIEVNKSVKRVGHGRYVLTRGANLSNADGLDFVLPAWVERAAVEDGEIVIYTKPEPFSLMIR